MGKQWQRGVLTAELIPQACKQRMHEGLSTAEATLQHENDNSIKPGFWIELGCSCRSELFLAAVRQWSIGLPCLYWCCIIAADGRGKEIVGTQCHNCRQQWDLWPGHYVPSFSIQAAVKLFNLTY